MNLPTGIEFNPGGKDLIRTSDQTDRHANIHIDPRAPGNADYKINDRRFQDAIAPYLHGDWEDFDRLFQLNPQRLSRYRVGGEERLQESSTIYSGAEHTGNPKKPNITVLPNLSITCVEGLPEPYSVLGCTMGHFHTRPEESKEPILGVQEVYEFQSYGLLTLDREEGQVDIVVARGGDKVVVPNGCHMTLYNLEETRPLITLDFANPDKTKNPADKNLVKECGPVILAYFDSSQVVFTLNRLYINSLKHAAGVRLNRDFQELAERQIRFQRGTRLGLGAFLYEQLTRNPEIISQFARLGLQIKRATSEAVLEPNGRELSSRLYFSLPLAEAVRSGSQVYQYFCPETDTASSNSRLPFGDVGGHRLSSRVREIGREKAEWAQLQALDRPLNIVVEGAGDWVVKTLRPMFDKYHTPLPGNNSRYPLSVFYADDTHWTGRRPNWVEKPNAWEQYLDKADATDLKKYENLNPDVVFIVTPDYTHAAIARQWISRKAPVVLVEKPFDSQLANVENLLQEMGRSRKTAVLGLDHYQFYAAELYSRIQEIEKHLGGALASVYFFMTEKNRLEYDRLRTLQFGLTLDFIPHFLALLSYFGDVGTLDNIRVVTAGQYHPLLADQGTTALDITEKYRSETCARLEFTFQDYSGSASPVRCVSVVGKGFPDSRKYLKLIGVNGKVVRIDFSNTPATSAKDDNTLHIHSTKRKYDALLEDFIYGPDQNNQCRAIHCCLSIGEAFEVVRALERIWAAIHLGQGRPWLQLNATQLDRLLQE